MLPQPGVRVFDPAAFVTSSDTLVLITDDQAQTNVAPLTTMLLGEVIDAAKQHAARSRTGRLDPPLRVVGDEIANVAPLPEAPRAAVRLPGHRHPMVRRVPVRRADHRPLGRGRRPADPGQPELLADPRRPAGRKGAGPVLRPRRRHRRHRDLRHPGRRQHRHRQHRHHRRTHRATRGGDPAHPRRAGPGHLPQRPRHARHPHPLDPPPRRPRHRRRDHPGPHRPHHPPTMTGDDRPDTPNPPTTSRRGPSRRSARTASRWSGTGSTNSPPGWTAPRTPSPAPWTPCPPRSPT